MNHMFLRSEIPYTKFGRIIPLPNKIDSDSVKAKFECGVLIIQIPKSNKSWSPKKIFVN
jgi:HSP20 family molecular chaperone IbpA